MNALHNDFRVINRPQYDRLSQQQLRFLL